MKNRSVLLVLLIAALLLASCKFNRSGRKNAPQSETPNPTTPTTEVATTAEPQQGTEVLQFNIGRNDYIIQVDDTPREFIVHVPGGYDPSQPTPVVVMIHGSNQSGNIMYENTGWAAKSEAEKMIVVFPTGWKYPLLGENGLHEKWNTPNTEAQVVPGTELKDDVKFIRTIIEALRATFNVDDKRIYASGFSNGGGFVLTRLIPEMNDVFAAYSTGGAALLGEGTVSDVPLQVETSLYSVMGTNDNKIAEGQGISTPFPFTADKLKNDPNFYRMLEKTTALLHLGATFTAESDPIFTRLTFADSPTSAGNEYIFMMIRGMGHVYPSGDNNRAGINAADLFWDFFLKHPKP